MSADNRCEPRKTGIFRQNGRAAAITDSPQVGPGADFCAGRHCGSIATGPSRQRGDEITMDCDTCRRRITARTTN